MAAHATLLAAGLALVAGDSVSQSAARTTEVASYGRSESAYTSGASYGAPHFLLLCILLVFAGAGAYEVYVRYGSPEAKKKKKHHTGYGSVGQEEEGESEAPSILSGIKGLAGNGAGAVGGAVGSVTGSGEKFLSVLSAAGKAAVADMQSVGSMAADKAQSGLSDAIDVHAHLEKVKQGAAVVGNVASAAAEDAKKGAEAVAAKGLDSARSVTDVGAHLEAAKSAASAVGNIASAAAEDAKKSAQAVAEKGLESARSAAEAASPAKLVGLDKDGASSVDGEASGSGSKVP